MSSVYSPDLVNDGDLECFCLVSLGARVVAGDQVVRLLGHGPLDLATRGLDLLLDSRTRLGKSSREDERLARQRPVSRN